MFREPTLPLGETTDRAKKDTRNTATGCENRWEGTPETESGAGNQGTLGKRASLEDLLSWFPLGSNNNGTHWAPSTSM